MATGVEAGEFYWQMTAPTDQLGVDIARGNDLMGSLRSTAIGVGAAVAGIWGAMKIGEGIAASVRAAADAEQNVARLDAVIRATGEGAGFTTEQLQKFAGEIQRTTIFEDDAALGAMRMLAAFRNVRGDVFTDTMQAAMDMASALGEDLPAATERLGRILNNPIDGITRLKREGIILSESQQDLIKSLAEAGDVMGAQRVILEALKSTYGGAAAAVADTSSGAFAQLQNQIGEISETIGSAMLPGLKDMSQSLLANTEAAQGVAAMIGDALGTSLNWIASEAIPVVVDAFWALLEGVAVTVETASAVIQNFPDVLTYAGARMAQGVVDIGDWIAWLFSEVIPSYGAWFVDNFPRIFTDSFNAAITAAQNFAENMQNFIGELWDFLTSGGSDSIDMTWKPLLDGFEKTMDDLPEIAAKKQSALSEALGLIGDEAGDRVGNAVRDAAANAVMGVEEMRRQMEAKNPVAPNAGAPKAGEFQRPTFDDLGEDSKDSKGKAAKGKKDKDSEPKMEISMTGFVEAFDKMQQQSIKSEEERMVREQKAANDALAKANDFLQEIAKKVGSNVARYAVLAVVFISLGIIQSIGVEGYAAFL